MLRAGAPSAAASAEHKPAIIPQKQAERVIKVPEQQAREQGLRLK